jgi:hypothetical protein
MKRRELFEQIEARHAKRARRLVGRDDAARLRWLIRFAEDGGGRTSRLPSVNFDRVAAAIEAFAERGGALARSVGRDLTVEAAEQLARIVRDGLRAYANQVTPDFSAVDVHSLQFSLVPGSDSSPWMGPWRPLFLIAVGEVVRAERHRLRTCAAPSCDRLYFRRKRALYCSAKCSRQERMRRFRKDVERYRLRRHEYYLRRLARIKRVSIESMRKKVKRRPPQP